MINIRIAKNKEGEIVQRLVEAGGFNCPGMNWSDIAPYWLLASLDGLDAATIQVCPSKPIGRLEFLAIDEKIIGRKRVAVFQEIVSQACATLYRAGSQYASGLIPFDHKGYKKIIRRRGGVVTGRGNMLMISINQSGWLPPPGNK